MVCHGVWNGTASARGPSPSARARGATCQLRPPTPSQRRVTRQRRRLAGARCLWGGGSALRLAASAHRAALVVVGLSRMQEHCLGGRPLSFGARPWCDVPAAASNAKPAPRVSRGAGELALSVPGGVGTLRLAARARRAALVLVGPCLFKGYLAGKRPLNLPCAPAVRRASCGLQRHPTPHVARGAVTPSRAVSGEEAHYSSLLRARDVLRWLWSAYCLRKDTASVERPVSYRCAPVVRRDSCALQRQPAPLVSRGPGAPALATSGEEAQHFRLLRVHAVPCWLRSAYSAPKCTPSARGLSPSARARGATCQLRPPTPSSAACLAWRRRASAHYLRGGRLSTQAFYERAQCCAGCGLPIRHARALPRREASLLSARARGATCQLRPPTPSSAACLARRRCAVARCLWGGGAALNLAASARRAALVMICL